MRHPAVKLHHKLRDKLRRLAKKEMSRRAITRIHILLDLGEGYSIDEAAERNKSSAATAKRVRRSFFNAGWEEAITVRSSSGRPRILDSDEEKKLIALACSECPEGYDRWSIRLLVEKFRRKNGRRTSFTVVQRTLKEDGQKPWLKKNVVCSDA